MELTRHGAALPHHSFLSRLYTGTGAFEVVGRRRLWYGISGAIVAVAIVSILLRGFTFGIDFKGGTTVSFPRGDAQTAQVPTSSGRRWARTRSRWSSSAAARRRRCRSVRKRCPTTRRRSCATRLFDAFQPKGADGKPSKQAISDSAVSETWGGQITKKALIALVVFLVLVSLYITVRYERYMAISALTTMVFDLTVTAGVYSLVGFEVSPATVIGLLTILGFSLYDTVIVFDKVEENTHGFQHTTRRTFAEQANLAINQTFMRSINTSLISVLPVLALMVVAVWLLGVGTLKDLALVQLVGILVGTYSSIFFATPLLVTLRERTELVRTPHPPGASDGAAPARAPVKRAPNRLDEAMPKPRTRRRPPPSPEDSRGAAARGVRQAGAEQAGAGCAAGAAHRYPASDRQAKRRPAVVAMARVGRPGLVAA